VLLERVRELPAAQPLLERLADTPVVYLVGGAVRDLLMGKAAVDLDLVVEGDAAAIAASLDGELRVHDRFGTSTVVLGGHSYDFARARTERYAFPGALPEVEQADIDADLIRRDFTINAMAIALGGETPGELHAVPSSLEDLGDRRLRVLHDLSFIDDPTRLLRLARYASRLGFEVEPHTRALADAAVSGGALGTVSGPRIGAELRLGAVEQDPVAAFSCLGELRIDRAIHPGFGLEDPALARRAVALLPESWRIVMAACGRGMSSGELSALLDRLAFEAGDRDAIVAAATRADAVAGALSAARSASEIAQAVDGQAPEAIALAGALGPAQQARDWLTRLRHVGLEISGQDLLGAGVPEGPAIGRALRAALRAKLDGIVDGREQELDYALRAAGANG
jgi:tRNA nucleotidyltransferase (CCA-adding enzyme)